MVYIVEAVFGSEKEAKSRLGTLVSTKPDLQEYLFVEENSVKMKVSSEEKAEEVEDIFRKTAGFEFEQVEVVEVEEGGGKLESLKEGMKGVQKGFRQTQEASAVAADRIGGMTQAPKGGMTGQLFGEGGQSKRNSQGGMYVLETLYEKPVTIDDVPKKLQKFTTASSLSVRVRCSSYDKARGAKKMLKQKTDPVACRIGEGGGPIGGSWTVYKEDEFQDLKDRGEV